MCYGVEVRGWSVVVNDILFPEENRWKCAEWQGGSSTLDQELGLHEGIVVYSTTEIRAPLCHSVKALYTMFNLTFSILVPIGDHFVSKDRSTYLPSCKKKMCMENIVQVFYLSSCERKRCGEDVMRYV